MMREMPSVLAQFNTLIVLKKEDLLLTQLTWYDNV